MAFTNAVSVQPKASDIASLQVEVSAALRKEEHTQRALLKGQNLFERLFDIILRQFGHKTSTSYLEGRITYLKHQSERLQLMSDVEKGFQIENLDAICAQFKNKYPPRGNSYHFHYRFSEMVESNYLRIKKKKEELLLARQEALGLKKVRDELVNNQRCLIGKAKDNLREMMNELSKLDERNHIKTKERIQLFANELEAIEESFVDGVDAAFEKLTKGLDYQTTTDELFKLKRDFINTIEKVTQEFSQRLSANQQSYMLFCQKIMN